MSVVPLLVLCSLLLAAGGVLLFVCSVRLGDHEHADRLSLLPLEDDLPRRGRSLALSEAVKERRGAAVEPSAQPGPACPVRSRPQEFPAAP